MIGTRPALSSWMPSLPISSKALQPGVRGDHLGRIRALVTRYADQPAARFGRCRGDRGGRAVRGADPHFRSAATSTVVAREARISIVP